MLQSRLQVRAVARVLIRNAAGELLLCRSRSGKAWVPPGGTVDPGESLIQAARREAAEEAGLPVRVGPMRYMQEFLPAHGQELVLEVAFAALAVAEQPDPGEEGGRSLAPAGPDDRPWKGWFIQDPDGPRREVRWFSRAEVEALAEPVYPPALRQRFWEPESGDAYLGQVRG